MPPSPKDAFVIILDIGCPESNDGAKEFMKKSQECASMIVQKKIFLQGKTEVALILMGSKGSDNPLYDGNSYSNISIAFPLEEPTWDGVQTLEATSFDYCEEANWVEAILVALELIRNKEDRSKPYLEKKVILFTNKYGEGSRDTVLAMEHALGELRVALYLIHPVTDDANPFPNAGLLWAEEAAEKVNSSHHDIEEASESIMSFQKKKVKARAWNVCLDVGSKVVIAVSGYKKMNDNQKINWRDCLSSSRETDVVQEGSNQSFTAEGEIPDAEMYRVKEEIEKEVINVLPNQTRIERTDMISGYYFGSTLVPYRDEDHIRMKYESGNKCLSVVKITKNDYVPRYFWMGKTCYYFTARDNDQNAATAFSAFAQALDALKSVAIVRRVYCNGNAPRMGGLFPYIKSEKEYLVYIELPYANDLRQCALPELKVDHLTSDQLKAVDQLIDGMDLSSPMTEGSEKNYEINREWSDILVPHHVCDPYLQYVRRCISHRALHPGEPLPDIDPDLKKIFTQPHQSIKDRVSGTLSKIHSLFPNLGTIEPPNKKKRLKRGRTSEDAAVESDENEEDETVAKQVKEETENVEQIVVEMLNPTEDFNAAIESKTLSLIQVCKQMQVVILNLVIYSFGKEDYDKPKESLRLLRNTILKEDELRFDLLLSYNKWMENVYQQIQEKFKLGFWKLITQEKLTFVTHEECPESILTDAEVKRMVGDSCGIDETTSDEEELDMDEL